MRRSKIPEYSTWKSLRQRCLNKKNQAYGRYGGRGILICKRWDDFDNFYKDMGSKPSSKHSLDRIDNNGNYEPGNCRWATKLEQNRNRRSNLQIKINGKVFCRTELAETTKGISHKNIHSRTNILGWPIEKAISAPLRKFKEKPKYNGKTIEPYKLCVKLGIPTSTLSNRLKRGWTIKEALETPIKTQHRRQDV